MGRIIYTKVHNNFKKINNSYNWEKGCKLCEKNKHDKSFKEDEEFIRVDVEVTCMRGDDEVFCFHKGCWEKGKEYLKKRYGKNLRI